MKRRAPGTEITDARMSIVELSVFGVLNPSVVSPGVSVVFRTEAFEVVVLAAVLAVALVEALADEDELSIPIRVTEWETPGS